MTRQFEGKKDLGKIPLNPPFKKGETEWGEKFTEVTPL